MMRFILGLAGFLGNVFRLPMKAWRVTAPLLIALGVGVLIGSLFHGTAAANPESSSQSSPSPQSNSRHNAGGAVTAARTAVVTLSNMLLMSPSQREQKLKAYVATGSLAAERDRLDQSSPQISQVLGLPSNADNQRLAFFYVAVLDGKIVSYTSDTAKVKILSSTTSGRRDGKASLDVRGVQVLTMKWEQNSWRYVGSVALGEPQSIGTDETQVVGPSFSNLVQIFSEVSNGATG